MIGVAFLPYLFWLYALLRSGEAGLGDIGGFELGADKAGITINLSIRSKSIGDRNELSKVVSHYHWASLILKCSHFKSPLLQSTTYRFKKLILHKCLCSITVFLSDLLR